jgi:hypothetical protein
MEFTIKQLFSVVDGRLSTEMEDDNYKGDINKLGTIDWRGDTKNTRV